MQTIKITQAIKNVAFVLVLEIYSCGSRISITNGTRLIKSPTIASVKWQSGIYVHKFGLSVSMDLV
jgi:hypothetical protein